ncbi:MAG: hypothetical protein MSC30_17895 [Gaiellaceae bacterium MAG52_C11]|nr:hypothetical protein [Candidatus Gaiellasilicea maunaloa]
MENKIGGRRPELPLPPTDPFQVFRPVPPARPSTSQIERKKKLLAAIRKADQAYRSSGVRAREDAHEHLKTLQKQLEDLRFSMAISALPLDQQQVLRRERGSPEERKIRQEAFRLELERYQQQTAGTRRALAEWDARYGGNPGEYSTRLRIVEHLRAGVEAYARGDFRIPVGKVSWRILPPGPWGSAELSVIHNEVRRRHPGIRLDEARLPHADSLGPMQKFVGEDEFEGYFVFIFDKTDRVLLENPIEGNAAYIFRGDWTFLSKLSKGELLESYRYSVERVLHREAGNWKWRINRALAL